MPPALVPLWEAVIVMTIEAVNTSAVKSITARPMPRLVAIAIAGASPAFHRQTDPYFFGETDKVGISARTLLSQQVYGAFQRGSAVTPLPAETAIFGV